MANYTLVPVNTDEIRNHYGDDICDRLVPYQPHLFDNLMWGSENGKPTLVGGNVQLSDGSMFYLVTPDKYGFVVKKQYREDPNESDPVLRAWGDYDGVLFSASDHVLQDWFMGIIDNTEIYYQGKQLSVMSDSFKLKYRLRAFNCRRSQQYKGKITLYKCHKDLDDDRETAMRPARAIKLMFPELDHTSLNYITDEYLQKFAPRELGLHVSDSPDDFKLAYSGEQSNSENVQTTYKRKHMAHSCMRYEFSNLPQHPVEAYASGDFKIIYVLDQDGLVCSRCVVAVHGDQPQAGPIYGVSEQSIDMINDHLTDVMDAVQAGDADWSGARLCRIPNPDGEGFIAPYLDISPQHLTDDGKYLYVDSYGEIDASCYSGILGGYEYHCYCCEVGLTQDESYFSEHTEEYYCESCYYEEHIYCEYAGEDVHRDNTTTVKIMGTGGSYTEMVATSVIEYGDDFIYCDSDGEYWDCDSVTYIESEDIYVDPITLEADYFECDWTDEWYHNDEMCRTGDGEKVCKQALDDHEDDWSYNETDGCYYVNEEEL
tara:strand:- start:1006 stop:2631 length:1626 start_codon:yes stop_codon:yes gene_type:complete